MSDIPTRSQPRAFDVRFSDIGTVLTLLSRLPIPRSWHNPDRITQSPWAYPLAGALIGALAGIGAWAFLGLGVPAGPAAALGLIVMALLTGVLHEDGLADCADGLWGGSTTARRLEIMRDSRIGAYGTVALILSILVRWSLLSELVADAPVAAFVIVATVSRVPMALAQALMTQARIDGLAARVGRPLMGTALIALALGTALALIAYGWSGVIVMAAALIGPIPLLITAQTKIGGITGDILGGTQQLAEIAALIALVTVLT